jgi:hypothetical protein
MTSRHKSETIFLCSSPLQLIHAHLIRHNYLAGQDSDGFLFYEGPVFKQLLLTTMWNSVTELITRKRAHGNAQRNIASNLKAIFAEVHGIAIRPSEWKCWIPSSPEWTVFSRRAPFLTGKQT